MLEQPEGARLISYLCINSCMTHAIPCRPLTDIVLKKKKKSRPRPPRKRSTIPDVVDVQSAETILPEYGAGTAAAMMALRGSEDQWIEQAALDGPGAVAAHNDTNFHPFFEHLTYFWYNVNIVHHFVLFNLVLLSLSIQVTQLSCYLFCHYSNCVG